MNSFDFSQYDNEDDTPSSTVKTQSFEDKPSKPKKSEFDFGAYDYEELNEPVKEGKYEILRWPYQILSGIGKAITYPLDLLQMAGIGEALSEMDDLEQAYEREGKVFNREKYLSALQEQVESFPTQSNIERFIEEKTGAPLTAKTTGQKVLNIASTGGAFSPSGYLSRASGAATAGSIYGGLRAIDTPEPLAEILALGGSQGPRFITKAVKNKLPSAKSNVLNKQLIGEEVPISSYETASDIKKYFSDDIPPPPPGGGSTPPDYFKLPEVHTKTSGTSGRKVTLAPEKSLPFRPINNAPKDLEQNVGNLFSKNKFKNTTEAGKTIKSKIMKEDHEAYKQVNKNYLDSRTLNKEVITTHPELVQQIDTRLKDLKAIPDPSGPQKQQIITLNKLRKNLANFDAEGNIVDYKPISNQILIDQIQSTRQKIDYDFSHGNVKNIFKPMIGDLQKAVEKAAESTGNTAALEALKKANGSYKDWANAFDNDYIRPFRDQSNKDFSRLYKNSLEVDQANVIRDLLSKTTEGKTLERSLVRDIVEKDLKEFLNDPRSVSPKEFKKTLSELEAVLSPEEVQALKGVYALENQGIGIRAKFNQQTKPTIETSIASKYVQKSEEQILSLLDSRSGIKELRNDLKGNPKLFDVISKQKTRSILQDGSIEAEFTGNELYKVLNKEKNYEILSELIGKEATEEARQAAKQIANQKMNLDTVKKFGKYAGAAKFLKYIAPLI